MKMISFSLPSLILLTIPLSFSGTVTAEAKEMEPMCTSQAYVSRSNCSKDQFQCLNKAKCIKRQWYCDRANDCGDNSDEVNCNTDICPTDPPYYMCSHSKKCIPPEWICNDVTDCPKGDDEHNCDLPTRYRLNQNGPKLRKVFEWLNNQKMSSSSEKWGLNVDKIALMFYFLDEKFSILEENGTSMSEIAYELSLQLLSQLTRTELEDIPSTVVASYVNAFLVTCINPRNFHGYDIIKDLRNRVDNENYTNPYVLLALCNAGEKITEMDKKKLNDTFRSSHRTIWTDTQAVVVMALACASKQLGNEVDPQILQEMTRVLKQRQSGNGSVVNLPTTALVMQALISTDIEKDPDNFDDVKAFQEILRNQKSDGSFGDLMNTFLVTPVLACKSLADIKSDHCQYGTTDEISALEKLIRRSGTKIRVQYSLWFGNDKDLERNLILRVPQNTSLYRTMEIAAEIDSRFKFEYSVKDGKPYINAISGMRDNPLTGKFWLLYTIQDREPTYTNKSPADIIPKDNGRYVMWYRRGTWSD